MSPRDARSIEKQVRIPAPRPKVWRALADAREFGAWFGVRLAGPFVAGELVTGQVTHPGYEHLEFEARVERMEPPGLLSFRWHPAALDAAVDYSQEPTTRVEFRLEQLPEGTLLTVEESGFEALPPGRREEALRMNSEGWSAQLENIRKYVTR